MRRFFSGPGINNFDMALLKDTRITESVSAQFRAEAFNVFNHAQFMNPSGQVRQLGSGRFWICDWRSRSTHHADRLEVLVLGRVSPMLARPRSQSVLVLAALWAASCFAAWSQTRQQPSRRKTSERLSTRGKQTFASTCAHCHGLDGRGGERAPNIAENPKVQRFSDRRSRTLLRTAFPAPQCRPSTPSKLLTSKP